MDNRPVYLEAADAFAVLTGQVPAGAWERPGLGVWDVRALVGHGARSLTTVRDYLGMPAASVACETAADYYRAAMGAAASGSLGDVAARGVAAGQALGEDPPAAVRGLVAEVREALDAVAGNPVITTIAGGMRLQDYLPTRVLELTVHSLDLTDALGLEYRFPSEAVELTVALLGEVGVASGRAPQVMRVLTGRGGSAFSVL